MFKSQAAGWLWFCMSKKSKVSISTKGVNTIMKTKILLMLALVLTLVLAASAPPLASADSPVVPFKGTYHGVPVAKFDPTCFCVRQTFEFDGQATHLGESHFSATGTVYQGPPMWQFGEGTFIADNGDKLYWKFDGTGEFLPGGLVDFWGDYWITGGTGRFVDVTGEGTYSGTATPAPSPNAWGIISFYGKLYK